MDSQPQNPDFRIIRIIPEIFHPCMPMTQLVHHICLINVVMTQFVHHKVFYVYINLHSCICNYFTIMYMPYI